MPCSTQNRRRQTSDAAKRAGTARDHGHSGCAKEYMEEQGRRDSSSEGQYKERILEMNQLQE
jgi:hypothetical protein